MKFELITENFFYIGWGTLGFSLSIFLIVLSITIWGS